MHSSESQHVIFGQVCYHFLHGGRGSAGTRAGLKVGKLPDDVNRVQTGNAWNVTGTLQAITMTDGTGDGLPPGAALASAEPLAMLPLGTYAVNPDLGSRAVALAGSSANSTMRFPSGSVPPAG